MEKTYIAIDLKSFYASVECLERGLDPLITHLVVADKGRTEKTICLAVSPALKAHGVSGRARLFEAIQRVEQANAARRRVAPGHRLEGSSYLEDELQSNPALALDFIVAPPRMALYMQYSTRIYQIYLKYIAPEDMHIYSIDEVFIDATPYLRTYGVDAHDFAMMLIRDVLKSTGVTATAGIGPNLYLCKIAMDIEAKHVRPDKDGVRIAQLDEESYRQKLWTHQPLTDFWRVGSGYQKRLTQVGLYTMGDIARCSINQEELLYSLFGVNAELLIDHAWGVEPCTIPQIKAYRPAVNSLCSGQVLHCPYTADKARLVLREMADLMALDLVDKGLVTDQLVLTVGYDIENLTDPERKKRYKGPVTVDRYGRRVPKHAHGTTNLGRQTASAHCITDGLMKLYDTIVDNDLLIRRLTLTANRVVREADIPEAEGEQMDMFTDYAARQAEETALKRERRQQQAVLGIKKKYGKNAILKGMNLEEGATARDRNSQIGGHKA